MSCTTPAQDTSLEGSQKELSSRVATLIDAGHLTVILGGGHETAFGSHRGLFRSLGAAQIINLDAHFDLRSEDRRSEEHTSELQSRGHLVCRLPLEQKKP